MTLQEALRKLFEEIEALVPQAEFSHEALDRFFALRQKRHEQIDLFLKSGERYAAARERVAELVDATGEYLIRFDMEPERREERQRAIETLLRELPTELNLDEKAAPQGLAPAAGWNVTAPSSGRLLIHTPWGTTEAGRPSSQILRAVLAVAGDAQNKYP
ncbi:unnamed protein product, partial [marine sediment metagenome]